MQDTAGTWLMTVLTPSPLLIALMQTAASLPVLVLGLLAGATADIFDRRRLLLFWQAWMLAAVALLSLLTFFNIISPWVLLSLTFLLSVGTAMNSPAWQAIVPELVPREQLPEAVSLNSAGFNLARALGPALGGLTVAAFVHADTGAASTFLLNSLSFVGVIYVLYQWKRHPLFKSALPAERIYGSMRAGLRYVQYSPLLKAALTRAFVFTTFVSAVWALLAVVAAHDLHQGALGYGILNGSMGLGAVIGATSLPHVRRRLSADIIIAISTGVFIATLLVLAFVHYPLIIIPGTFVRGLLLDKHHVHLQSRRAALRARLGPGPHPRHLPDGLCRRHGSRQRHLGIHRRTYLHAHIPRRCRRRPADHPALKQSLPRPPRRVARSARHLVQKWLVPQLAIEPHMSDGPVSIVIDFHVDPENYNAFVHAIHELRDIRLRDGAMRWGVFQDVDDLHRVSETFIMESWIDYLRQHERFTTSDHVIHDRVFAFHTGPEPPRVTHTIYAKERTNGNSGNPDVY